MCLVCPETHAPFMRNSRACCLVRGPRAMSSSQVKEQRAAEKERAAAVLAHELDLAKLAGEIKASRRAAEKGQRHELNLARAAALRSVHEQRLAHEDLVRQAMADALEAEKGVATNFARRIAEEKEGRLSRARAEDWSRTRNGAPLGTAM